MKKRGTEWVWLFLASLAIIAGLLFSRRREEIEDVKC